MVKGKGLGKVTMPGRHGCKELCEGCQLRRCCCRPGPAEFAGLATNGALLHLCHHCDTLFHKREMTLGQVRFENDRILHAHAAKLGRAVHASRRVRALVEHKEQKRGE